MNICPMCNGMQKNNVPCDKCNTIFTDKGKVKDYLDNYSPYPEGQSSRKACLHLLYCENCSHDTRYPVSLIVV